MRLGIRLARLLDTLAPQEAPMRGLCPFARHMLIPPGSNDPAIKPRVAILHVDAGNASSLFEFFRDRSGGIESHFFVRADGGIEQYRDIFHQADANLDANDFAVSIETQGFGAGEWNDAQLASIKRLLLWLHDEAGIPLRKVQRWNGSGVGYHTLFGAPSHWTPVSKSCPGPDRIKQFNRVLVPWMHAPTSEENDMQLSDKISDDGPTVAGLFRQLDNFMARQDARQKAALKLLRGLPDSPEVRKIIAALED